MSSLIDKHKVLAGRKAVDAYRKAHTQLHAGGWYKGISEEHTPLLNKLVATLEKLGFTLASFWVKSNKYCLVEAEDAISEFAVYRDRQDLAMLGEQKKYNGVELKGTHDGRELIIDSKLPAVMNTSIEEHFSMLTSAQECPDNARVFIGGLGLGLILLYLNHLGKAKDVVVCEIDDRVIHLLGEQITGYFDTPIQIIHGDAFEEIKKHGKFDWVYVDLTEGAPPQFNTLVQPVLTDNGVYTPYNPMTWQVWK